MALKFFQNEMLSEEELFVLKLQDAPPQVINRDTVDVKKELETIRTSQLKLITEARTYCTTICR